jgi:hypothetical protein
MIVESGHDEQRLHRGGRVSQEDLHVVVLRDPLGGQNRDMPEESQNATLALDHGATTRP